MTLKVIPQTRVILPHRQEVVMLTYACCAILCLPSHTTTQAILQEISWQKNNSVVQCHCIVSLDCHCVNTELVKKESNHASQRTSTVHGQVFWHPDLSGLPSKQKYRLVWVQTKHITCGITLSEAVLTALRHATILTQLQLRIHPVL